MSFPVERHQQIVARIDQIECDLYGLYRALERLRLDLQREWRVLPSGERWNEARQDASELSAGGARGAEQG